MTDKFEKLAEKLSEKQKLAFLRILNEHGISVESDTVLSKFFLTLQIYVSLYEKIPEGIHNATTWFNGVMEKATKDFQKPVSDIAQLKTHIEKLTMQADQSAKNVETQRTRINQDFTLMYESMKSINSSIKKGADNAAATVSNSMKEWLSDAVKKALPLSNIKEAGVAFSDAVNQSKQASAELRANVKDIRWAHFRAYALVCVAVIFAIWVHIHYRYEAELEKERAAYAENYEDNNAVLLILAKTNRKLEYLPGEENNLLIIRNAEGWTSKTNNGVIAFKD